jgi:hypothetical protein
MTSWRRYPRFRITEDARRLTTMCRMPVVSLLFAFV